MSVVLVDSSALFSLLCADCREHRAARVILKQMQAKEMMPVLTNYIVAETHDLLKERLGPDAGRTWLRHNIWHVENLQPEDEKKVKKILLGGGNYTYTDAASFAVMERLGIKKAFTFKDSFARYGFEVLDIELEE